MLSDLRDAASSVTAVAGRVGGESPVARFNSFTREPGSPNGQCPVSNSNSTTPSE